MNANESIERYGHLIKLETLRTVSSQKIPGTLVLEAPEPFPGYLEYYSERPHFSQPLYVYFVLEGQSTLEEVARATQIARTIFPFEFDAAYALVKLKQEVLHTIRVRHLHNFDQVPKLQEIYQRIGLKFQKRTRDINESTLITIKKLFHLKPVGADIYLDKGEPDQGYFSLPFHVRWDDFAELVQKVKFNWNVSKSDFALGFFYTNDRIEDVVRVYNPGISSEYLAEARRQFMNRI